MKIELKTNFLPHITPLVLVVSGDNPPNPSTYIYFGQLNDRPPIVGLGMKEKRHTYSLIKRFGDFTINIVNSEILKEADRAGFLSGKKYDKTKIVNLTFEKSFSIKSMRIVESPISYEVKYMGEVKLFDHNLIYGEVLKVFINEKYLKNGSLDIFALSPVLSSYYTTEYYSLGDKLGKWGISLKEED